MTVKEVMTELEALGSPTCKRIFQTHGAPENLFGVRVQDLKILQKRLKKNHVLSLRLFETGNSDAQYLAGLIADEQKISADELRNWAAAASWSMISDYAVAWVAAESPHGWLLAAEWIDAPEENRQSGGWATLASLLAVTPDEKIDKGYIKKLLQRVKKTIHDAPDRVRYNMNGFVIACGCSVPELTEEAMAAAKHIGKVHVNMGGTSCKVPDAVSYIEKCHDKGTIGKKKKKARC